MTDFILPSDSGTFVETPSGPTTIKVPDFRVEVFNTRATTFINDPAYAPSSVGGVPDPFNPFGVGQLFNFVPKPKALKPLKPLLTLAAQAANEAFIDPAITALRPLLGDITVTAFSDFTMGEIASGAIANQTAFEAAASAGKASASLARAFALLGAIPDVLLGLLWPGELSDLPPPPEKHRGSPAAPASSSDYSDPFSAPGGAEAPSSTPDASQYPGGSRAFVQPAQDLAPVTVTAQRPAGPLQAPTVSIQPSPFTPPQPFIEPFPGALAALETAPHALVATNLLPQLEPPRSLLAASELAPALDFISAGLRIPPQDFIPKDLLTRLKPPGLHFGLGTINLPNLGDFPNAQPELNPEPDKKCKAPKKPTKCRQGYFRERPGSETVYIKWSSRQCPSSSLPNL